MKEIWVDIPNYEGHYQVSSCGNVRSVKRGVLVLKGDFQHNGYRRVYLWKNGKQKHKLVHRLVALAFVENPKQHKEVNHLDENKANNHATNLEWCSRRYNMNYGSVREKISQANVGKSLSQERRKEIGEDTSKRRWVNDGRTEKYVYYFEIDKFIEKGWDAGRLNRKKEV